MQVFHIFLSLLTLLVAVASQDVSITVTQSAISTATITVTASPTIASNAPEFTNLAAFTSAVLNSTNVIRADFGAAAVSWNDTLAGFAAAYLVSMGPLPLFNGTECNFSHSGGPYGENIALGCTEVTGCVDLCEFCLLSFGLTEVCVCVCHV